MHCVSSRLRPHHHQYSHYGAFTYTVSASAATGPPAFVMRTVSAKLGRARTYGRIFRQLRTVDVSAVWLSSGAGFRDLRSYAAYADSRPRLDAQSYNVTLWVPRALAFDVLRPGPEAGSGWAGAIPLVDFEGIARPAKGRKDDTGSEEGPQH